METRKITVVSTRDQKRTVVETNATTLAELKDALAQANVDYTGMTFYEALTRTELLNDDSVLPHDVPYKGEVTNELVFMLTNPNKKIKSGALSEARVALYNEIVNGGFAEAVVLKYGKNFTNCSNAELAAFLDEVAQAAAPNCCADTVARKAIEKLIDILYDENYLTCDEVEEINDILSRNAAESDIVTPTPYSEEELEEIMAGLPEFVR